MIPTKPSPTPWPFLDALSFGYSWAYAAVFTGCRERSMRVFVIAPATKAYRWPSLVALQRIDRELGVIMEATR